MKKLFLIVLSLCLCTCIFVACHNEPPATADDAVQISGVWQFSGTAWNYDMEGKILHWVTIEEDIRFVSNGKAFSKMTMASFIGQTSHQILSYDETIVCNYKPFVAEDDGAGNWESANYKTVDFGTEPQTVSKDFYNWLAANASPIT